MHFFNWNCIWFGQKEPIKVQNFRFSTAHVKFHQSCALIVSFCWNYIKFLLKRYRRVISHDTEKWCRIWKKNWFIVSKMTRILWSLTRALESLRKSQRIYLYWHWRIIKHLKEKSTCRFELKIYRRVIYHDNEEWCKIWRGIDFLFPNLHQEFHKSRLEHSNNLLFNGLL